MSDERRRKAIEGPHGQYVPIGVEGERKWPTPEWLIAFTVASVLTWCFLTYGELWRLAPFGRVCDREDPAAIGDVYSVQWFRELPDKQPATTVRIVEIYSGLARYEILSPTFVPASERGNTIKVSDMVYYGWRREACAP